MPTSPTDSSGQWPEVLDEVTGALETLSAFLDGEQDINAELQVVCEQVERAVPGVDEATVTLVRAGNPVTAATTSDEATRLDIEQYEEGDGPCLEAAATGKVVRVAVSDVLDRWPVFARSSAEAGMGSFLSAPLVVDQQHSGAINCYSRAGHGFADLDAALLELFTTAVEIALRAQRRYRQSSDLAANLRTALTSRAVIDQAKGILMAVHGIDADAAFAMLADQSQRDNTKLRDVAEQLIATTVRRGD